MASQPPKDAADGKDGDEAGSTPQAIFVLLWSTLVDVLGTTPLAILLRRALMRSVPAHPGLSLLSVKREGFGYRYDLPPKWSGDDRESWSDLRALIDALMPQLADLAGPAAVRRVTALDPLYRHGLLGKERSTRDNA